MSGAKGQRYERLFESDEEAPPHEQILMSHDSNKWSQILNLDDFFTRIYHYHQNNGFWCMFINDLLQLVQFAFVVFFVVFLSCCINYDELGRSDPDLWDAIDWSGLTRIHGFVFLLAVIAIFYWGWKCFKFIWNTTKYLEIKLFYKDVLKINEDDISNLDWLEVQSKLIDSQKEVQLCLHKENLTELDISNRILRTVNYKLAMINKNVLPYSFEFPLLGQRVFLSKVLMANLEFIIFTGPWAPFKNSWKLDERYKKRESREVLAERLTKYISYLAFFNFLLMPFIFVWQFIFHLVHYAEIVKREPGFLGVRMWSLYSRHFLRHYNELNHEFDARLKKAYIPANKYLNLFTSPMMVIIAKNVGFFAGAILLVLVTLTLINEELLFADNIPLAITVLGITVSVCRALVPDANTVYCPDLLMKEVLQHTHYQPDSWNNGAHLPHVRQQFSQMFVFKGVYLAEELISPLLTPFILYFNVRLRALDFVDFLRNYTVNVVGVGDVCSFSQMDIKRHGNPDWMSFGMTTGSQLDQAEHGKTELSLINFSIRNPDWKPHENEAMYISTLRALAKQDGEGATQNMMNSMAQSMTRGSLNSPSSMLASMNLPSFHPPDSHPSMNSNSTITDETVQHPGASHETHPEDMLPEGTIDPSDGMQTSLAQKRYIFDDQYTQLEQSYRDTRQPITMTESVPELLQSVAGISNPDNPGDTGNTGNPGFANQRVTRSLTDAQHFPPGSMMSMSTLDASLFMSASPHMQHSQWAASSSLSQGPSGDAMKVSWTEVRRKYRQMAKSNDLNSSALYLHSLHNRLKQQQETAEDMMTRSLHSQIHQQREERLQGEMSRSYPADPNV
ncbi:autophagy-related protein 9A-like [Bolinopsis microptera]|uniref:autophagy-related protein 9A-like n=1 Tax=Bolinopsis microptera TaxID=2820187 RepID=UPI00307A9C32